MKVGYRIFESGTGSWESLASKAAEFANSLRDGQLINISHAAAGGQQFGGAGANGIVIVWYRHA